MPSIFFARAADGWPSASNSRAHSHAALRRYRPEADQVGKDRYGRCGIIEAVGVPYLCMTVAIRGVSKFKWNKRVARRRVVAAIASKQEIDQLPADEPRQELAQHDGLIVPT